MFSKKSALLALAAVLVVCALFVSMHTTGRALDEEAQLLLMPSAQRAYSLGVEHFDAVNAEAYNIDRAEHLFKKAHELDPKYPHVNHQLARIAFLRGHFNAALAYINMELSTNPSPSPSSYYMRGLIKGYMERYDDSAKDYAMYIEYDPTNWAATNDLAWVLLKAKRYQEALTAIDKVLPLWPTNPWLLNSYATALYELGRLEEAKDAVERANSAVQELTESEWSQAYPGNDPLIASEGLSAFKKAVSENMHTISVALHKSSTSVR